MTPRLWDVCFVGFGTVAQGLAEILVERRQAADAGASGAGAGDADAGGTSAPTKPPLLHYPIGDGHAVRVVAIITRHHGQVCDPGGIDLVYALGMTREGRAFEDPDSFDVHATMREARPDILIETTPTLLRDDHQPGYAYANLALALGIHVVTTNKDVALAGAALESMAAETGVRFLCEGAVMSGTPAISFARQHLAGCKVRAIQGILNGTTNFILGSMEDGYTEYEDALAEAQRLGIAEADPSMDVGGGDAAAKLVILANLLFEHAITLEDVRVTGIEGVSQAQVLHAGDDGLRYKLVARAIERGDHVEAVVEPVAMRLSDPLAGVSGTQNAVTFETDLLGSVTVTGPGAGGRETGFALLADLIEITRGAGRPGARSTDTQRGN